jgi:hypothetical protein
MTLYWCSDSLIAKQIGYAARRGIPIREGDT